MGLGVVVVLVMAVALLVVLLCEFGIVVSVVSALTEATLS